jgi:signal peptidase
LKALASGANIVVSLMLAVVAIGLAFVAVPFFGNKALIVRSASMQPTIPVGGLVVVKPQEELLSPLAGLVAPIYREGDIVAFKNEKNQKIITTHRIVAQELKDGKIFYQTKGDANKTPDNGLVSEKNVVGKSRFSAPFIGKLFSFTKSNIGFPLLVIFPALLVIIFESINIFKEFRKQQEIYQNKPFPNFSVTGFKILIPLVVGILIIPSSFAFFSDSETSTNNIFQASTIFPTPTPTPTPTSSEPFVDDVTEVVGTFGHCCDAGNLSSDPAVAKPLVTGAPDSPPDLDFIQISDNSSVTLKFVDNKALPTGNSDPDIRIHVYDDLFPAEAMIEVSQDGTTWFFLGNYFDTSDVDLNIESTFLTEVKYVRLTDLVAGGDPYPTLGFDLDAVEALNSAPE